jgi:hypothetical protein
MTSTDAHRDPLIADAEADMRFVIATFAILFLFAFVSILASIFGNRRSPRRRMRDGGSYASFGDSTSWDPAPSGGHDDSGAAGYAAFDGGESGGGGGGADFDGGGGGDGGGGDGGGGDGGGGSD